MYFKCPTEQVDNVTVIAPTSAPYQKFDLGQASTLLNGDLPSGMDVVRSILTVTSFTADGKLFQQQVEIDHPHQRIHHQGIIVEGAVGMISIMYDQLLHIQCTEYSALGADAVAIFSMGTQLILKDNS